MYNVKHFKNKFKAIHANRWTVGRYSAGDKCCALGHCGFPNLSREGEALQALFKEHGLSVVEVNDGHNRNYRQANPKARILAALNYMDR
jgi:hypothetical protein